MDEQELFYPGPPTWTSKWCTGAKYHGKRLTQPHWAETAAGGDSRKWNYNRCYDCGVAHGAYQYSQERDAVLEYHRQWRINNPELSRERDARASKRAGGKYAKKWRDTHPDAVHRQKVQRRTLESKAVCRHGTDCFAKAKRAMPQACAYCNATDNIQADHWMPLALGGLDCKDNLQPLCKAHNSGKRDTHPLEYEARIGFVRT